MITEDELMDTEPFNLEDLDLDNPEPSKPTEKMVFRPLNLASADNERPVMLFCGKEDVETCQEVIDHLEEGANFFKDNELVVNFDGLEINVKCELKLVQLDGKATKLVQGRHGAFCLLCSMPRDEVKNRKLVLEGMPMDIDIHELWSFYNAVADEDLYKHDYKIDTKVIKSEWRGGVTHPPLAKELEVGGFLPPLHARIRSLCFFSELICRQAAGNYDHGHTSDDVKKWMEKVKREFTEKTREAIGRPVGGVAQGGSTDDGNTSRLVLFFKPFLIFCLTISTHSRAFFDHKNREAVISMYKTDNPLEKKYFSTLMRNFSVILDLINSSKEIDVEGFEKLCKTTNLILLDHFPWMNIYPTIHSVSITFYFHSYLQQKYFICRSLPMLLT